MLPEELTLQGIQERLADIFPKRNIDEEISYHINQGMELINIISDCCDQYLNRIKIAFEGVIYDDLEIKRTLRRFLDDVNDYWPEKVVLHNCEKNEWAYSIDGYPIVIIQKEKEKRRK